MTAGKCFDMEEEFAGLDFHPRRLEDRFIQTMEKTTTFILTYSIIAGKILNMTYDGPPGVKTVWIGLMKLYILPAYREYLS